MYSQVTQLFNAAPDLLEDFKQFLPESAAQARAAVAERMLSDESRREPPASGPMNPTFQNGRSAAPEERPSANGVQGSRLPPIGNFAPPPAAVGGKEKRKRNSAAQQTPQNTAVAVQQSQPMQIVDQSPLPALTPSSQSRVPANKVRYICISKCLVTA